MWRISIVALLLLASSGYGGVEGQVSFGGGIGLPLQPDIFTDYWNLGPSFKVEGGIVVANRVAFLGGISYSLHSLDEKAMLRSMGLLWTPVQLTGGGVSIVTLTGGANVYMVPDTLPASPYLIARCGYFRLNLDDLAIIVPGEGSASVPMGGSDAFALEGGLGLSIRTGHYLSAFCEGVYVHGMESGDDTGAVQIRVGLRMRFSGA